MGDRTGVVRLLCGGAALATLAIGSVGCSSDASPDAAASTTSVAPTTSPATSTTTTSTTAAVAPTSVVPPPTDPATTVPIDGAAVLAAALDSIAPGYHFTTTVTIDGNVVLTADGDRVGDGTRVGVVRDEVVVQYVITPAGTWVQPEGGDWEELDTPAATTDPIGALRTPAAVTVDGVDGTAIRLSVTVPASSLGLIGDEMVVVSTVIDGGTLTEVDYQSTVDDKPASVQAVFGAMIDSSPVVPPV